MAQEILLCFLAAYLQAPDVDLKPVHSGYLIVAHDGMDEHPYEHIAEQSVCCDNHQCQPFPLNAATTGLNAIQVVNVADYDVIVMYRSSTAATFKLSLGPYSSIVAGTAPSLTAQLMPSVSVSAPAACLVQLTTVVYAVDASASLCQALLQLRTTTG